jgi:hypothetical protein
MYKNTTYILVYIDEITLHLTHQIIDQVNYHIQIVLLNTDLLHYESFLNVVRYVFSSSLQHLIAYLQYVKHLLYVDLIDK